MRDGMTALELLEFEIRSNRLAGIAKNEEPTVFDTWNRKRLDEMEAEWREWRKSLTKDR